MNPNDPWAIPPLPEIGHGSKLDIYTSVGRALTEWEGFESVFSILFMYFTGLEYDTHRLAHRAYGAIVTFNGRADMMKAAADAYFAQFPDARFESDFATLIKDARRASPRRNDIAHGRVEPFPRTGYTEGPYYCLVPPFYRTNRNSLAGEPTYAYTPEMIDGFALRFRQLASPAIVGRAELARRRAKRPPVNPPPELLH
jgi:hypothetical protein